MATYDTLQVDIGSAPNDSQGDPLRQAFDKINQRFQELRIFVSNRGDWQPNTAYTADPNRDWVIVDGVGYLATSNHVSGSTFAADLAAGKWVDSDSVKLRADLASTASGNGAELVGFKQAGTGAVDRTALAKMREAVSVKDFGAIGDGVTDDTAAINSASLALKNVGGGTLFFPCGMYLVSNSGGNQAIIGRENVSFVGDGVGATVIKLANNANAHCFQIDEVKDVTVSRMTIDGNADNQSLIVHGILFRGTTNLRLVDLVIKKTNGYGIGGQNFANKKIFIDRVWGYDTGFNVIDIKNKNNENDSIVLSNILCERWGLNTNESSKAGITVRGRATLSNIVCRDFGGDGTSAVSGVRLRDGESSEDNGIGGHFSVVSNVVIQGNSKVGTIGVEILARNCAVSNISVSGTSEGVVVAQRDNALSGIVVTDCDIGCNFKTIPGFASSPSNNTLSSFVAKSCETGLRVNGFRNSISSINITECAVGVNNVTGANYNSYGPGVITGSETNFIDNGVGSWIQGLKGVPTEISINTGDVAVDAVANPSITVAHGLYFTPSKYNFQITPVFDGPGWTDAEFYFRVNTADATNVTVQTLVKQASGIPGAKIRYNITGKLKNSLAVS